MIGLVKAYNYQIKTNKTQNMIQSNTEVTKRQSRFDSIRKSFKKLGLDKISCKISNKVQEKLLNEESVDIFQKWSDQTRSDKDPSSPWQIKQHSFKKFDQKYRILEKLGSGGNACVYKCQHIYSNNFYAVKKTKVSEQRVQEMKQNYKIISELDHPHICKYKDLFLDENQSISFIVMEYCPYPSLASHKVVNEKELVWTAKQIFLGIQYLHQNDISHRDIKPENILYDQKNKILKIVDFQLSKKTLLNGIKRDFLTITGSNFYFAPEILLGGGYDQGVDLWAFGITIYKLVAGYTPFQSEYYSQTNKNILKGELKFTDKKWKGYSLQAKCFISKLIKRKNQRMTLEQCKNHSWFVQASC